jgi:transcriptional regulator with XRE-family HTH domain
VSFISKQFADELAEKAMRDAYLDAQTRTKVAQQIRALRIQRGWSQAELGHILGKPQSNVHRLEDRDVARYTLTTLLELATAYDCGLVVEFVSYEDFLRRTSDLSPTGLQVPSFSANALEPLWRDQISAEQSEQAITISIYPPQLRNDWLHSNALAMLALGLGAPGLVGLGAAFPSNWQVTAPTVGQIAIPDVGNIFRSSASPSPFLAASSNQFFPGRIPPPEDQEVQRLKKAKLRIAQLEQELAERDQKLAEFETVRPAGMPEIPPAHVIFERNRSLNLGI